VHAARPRRARARNRSRVRRRPRPAERRRPGRVRGARRRAGRSSERRAGRTLGSHALPRASSPAAGFGGQRPCHAARLRNNVARRRQPSVRVARRAYATTSRRLQPSVRVTRRAYATTSREGFSRAFGSRGAPTQQRSAKASAERPCHAARLRSAKAFALHRETRPASVDRHTAPSADRRWRGRHRSGETAAMTGSSRPGSRLRTLAIAGVTAGWTTIGFHRAAGTTTRSCTRPRCSRGSIRRCCRRRSAKRRRRGRSSLPHGIWNQEFVVALSCRRVGHARDSVTTNSTFLILTS